MHARQPHVAQRWGGYRQLGVVQLSLSAAHLHDRILTTEASELAVTPCMSLESVTIGSDVKHAWPKHQQRWENCESPGGAKIGCEIQISLCVEQYCCYYY